MSGGMKWIIFATGFMVALINYIHLDVFNVIISNTKTEAIIMTYQAATGGEQVFIALGFALVYCVIGGMFAMMGGHLYIFICKSFGVNNRLYRILKPGCEDEDCRNE